MAARRDVATVADAPPRHGNRRTCAAVRDRADASRRAVRVDPVYDRRRTPRSFTRRALAATRRFPYDAPGTTTTARDRRAAPTTSSRRA
ncbi:hypothetical protein WT56_29145 [Burkholderia pseudomultivorans]|uniref:Uncharacterized protein n=1 Tax=Burkholderia pseudomultivorans TaxID=1207504 RepID=A0A132E8E2_9BURK|nr:hypothetical protein WT56_29145 [Burkholderia pseudomultivorans]